jgi:hypothetical protein
MKYTHMIFKNWGKCLHKSMPKRWKEGNAKKSRLHMAASEGMAMSLNVYLQSSF